MKNLCLCGDWQVTCLSPEKGTFTYTAPVPGCAFTDMQRMGRIEDPFWRFNNQQNGWLEQADFTYVKTFEADAAAPGAYLEFDGLDTFCSVWLNGVKLGEADDMFLRYRFPVGDALRAGENTLEVRFRSAVREVADKPLTAYAFTGERVWIRRMQCTFRWDWVDRFVTCGIFRPVRLCCPGKAELERVYVRTTALDAFGAQVAATMEFAVQGEGAMADITLTGPDGAVLLHKRRLIVEPVMDETVDLPAPQLWWPNGYGSQPLYHWNVQVYDGDLLLGGRDTRFGVRTVRLLQTPDSPGGEWEAKCRKLKEQAYLADTDQNESFSRMTILVNGKPILAKGAAWVPCEPFTSAVRDEKYRELVRLARDAHFNILRVWGGGQFEGDAFFDACDEAGIMISHDFLMACATYPEWDDWFMQHQMDEVEYGAERLRNHACLMFWTGDNENAADGNENMQDYPGRRAAWRAIEPVLKRMDPARPFVPGSPYGGVPNKSQTKGVTHNTFHLGDYGEYALAYRDGKRDMSDYKQFYEGKIARYIAEDPVMGAPQLCSLRRFMNDEDIFGADKACWRFHTKNNPTGVFEKFELFDMTEAYAQGILGAFSGDVDRVFKLQYVEYETVRVTMENIRRNKWFSSAIIYWMFNDCWPASGWSIVDYYALPKAAWYGFARAAKPVIASITEEDGQLCVYVCNDTLQAVNGAARLFVQPTAQAAPRWQYGFDVSVPANSSACVLRVPKGDVAPLLGEDAVLLCELGTNLGADRAFWLPGTLGALRRPSPSVRVLRVTADAVTVCADTYAHAVAFDGEYVFSDNYFSLLPGEEKTVTFRDSYLHEKDGFELLVW